MKVIVSELQHLQQQDQLEPPDKRRMVALQEKLRSILDHR